MTSARVGPRLFNHHADGRVAARDSGFAALREIVRADVGRGVLVMGDFNEHPDGPLARRTSTVRVWPTERSDHHAVLADLEW